MITEEPPPCWTRNDCRQDLDDCLTNVLEARSAARRETTPPGVIVETLFKGLNCLMNARRSTYALRGRPARDIPVLCKLLTVLPPDDQQWLMGQHHLAALASFSSLIETNLPLGDHRPTERHETFRDAYKAGKDPIVTLNALAAFIWTIRSNSLHGGKTARGPDEMRTERNRQVSLVVLPVLCDILDVLLKHPSQRLACYGTLRPGEFRHDLLSGLRGTWTDGHVRGVLTNWNGYPRLRWSNSGGEVPVRIFTSEQLVDVWDQIDATEGRAYLRSLIPASVGGSTVITSCYLADS